MTFLAVLITLVIERMAAQHRPARHFAWFERYCRWLAGMSSLGGLMSHAWGAVVVLIPILATVLWLQLVSAEMGILFHLPFSVVVLLYCLGPRDLGDDADAFLAARDSGDNERATELAQQLCRSKVTAAEPRRSFAVARAVVILANRSVIAPLFWFVVFGPVGAAAYRLIHQLAERLQTEQCPASMQRGSDDMRHIADWLPSRITAAGYAIAGNFDAVAHAWRSFDYLPGDGPLDEADNLLANTGLAALDTFPDDADELAGDAGLAGHTALIPPVVEDALALVWRSLAMWVAVIGGGSLIALMA